MGEPEIVYLVRTIVLATGLELVDGVWDSREGADAFVAARPDGAGVGYRVTAMELRRGN